VHKCASWHFPRNAGSPTQRVLKFARKCAESETGARVAGQIGGNCQVHIPCQPCFLRSSFTPTPVFLPCSSTNCRATWEASRRKKSVKSDRSRGCHEWIHIRYSPVKVRCDSVAQSQSLFSAFLTSCAYLLEDSMLPISCRAEAFAGSSCRTVRNSASAWTDFF
jgi:hypothetical protein